MKTKKICKSYLVIVALLCIFTMGCSIPAELAEETSGTTVLTESAFTENEDSREKVIFSTVQIVNDTKELLEKDEKQKEEQASKNSQQSGNVASEQKNETLEQKNETSEQKNETSEQKNAALEQKNVASEQKNDVSKQKNGALKQSDAELEKVCRDLFTRHMECMRYCGYGCLPTEPGSTLTQEGLQQADTSIFPDYASFEKFIRDIYTADMAEYYLNNGRYLNRDGKLFMDLNFCADGAYYASFQTAKIEILSKTENTVDFKVTGTVEWPAENPVKEAYPVTEKMILGTDGWRLSTNNL